MDEKQMEGSDQETGPGLEGKSQVTELRTAVRFPMRLPVQIKADRGEEQAETINVSASGMLFAFERCLEMGSPIEFDLKMPAGSLGTEKDVVVHCVGRVVRCYRKGETDAEIAAVIDRYQMLS
ncbi:MAG TPA: PilZ domain-containing protein [Acidobacteriaceae bacterium]|jgi:hypothetical protein|nr:PilZ domain-containing protein [Acidobacteriaceae bacterium]